MAVTRLISSVEERTRVAQGRVGQVVLDKWRLDRLVGVGGMAAVFEATDRNGNKVALKILHPDLAGFDEVRERFVTEAYAANRVAHPGVVRVRDEGTTADGAVFLVMDLLRGQTVSERLEAGSELFSVGEVLELASQLLDVLVHAHRKGVVHRDIKPENIFLTPDQRVRLLDFGIARIEASVSTHSTEPGTTLGTPAFMPPEQALGRWGELDGRSDLWALGATMYLLLSGVPVRDHGSSTEQLLSAMTLPARSLGDVASLPRSIVAVVDRALAFDREQRFPDARSMQLAVRAALDELSLPDARVTLPPSSLEPMALSQRYQRPSVHTTMRPVSANAATATARAGVAAPRGALSLYVTLGFALGLGIVVAARLNVRPMQPANAAPPAPGAAPYLTVVVPPRAGALAPTPSESAAPAARPAKPTPKTSSGPVAVRPAQAASAQRRSSGRHIPQ